MKWFKTMVDMSKPFDWKARMKRCWFVPRRNLTKWREHMICKWRKRGFVHHLTRCYKLGLTLAVQKRLSDEVLASRKRFVDLFETEIRDIEAMHERHRPRRGSQRSLARSLQENRRKEREGTAHRLNLQLETSTWYRRSCERRTWSNRDEGDDCYHAGFHVREGSERCCFGKSSRLTYIDPCWLLPL